MMTRCHSMRLRLFWRYDPTMCMVRLGRIVWQNSVAGELVGQGGYSCKLSLALRPALFSFYRDYDGWRLTLAGLRLHFKRSYGGVFPA